MSRQLSVLVLCLVSLSACAHRGAVRVDCNGPLRPINRAAPLNGNTPVSPAAPTAAPSQSSAGEGRHEG
jgi:hypothetical protein